MVWLIGLGVVVILTFGLIVLRGAPYVPTHRKQIKTAFDLLDLKPGMTVVDFGSGDGSVLVEGARRQLNVIGYELNPILWFISRVRLRTYPNAKVFLRDMWREPVPDNIDGIFVFLTAQFMPNLNQKLHRELKKPVKLVSYAFALPHETKLKTSNGLHLYEIRPG